MMWTVCPHCGAEVLAKYMYDHVLWHERDESEPCDFCGHDDCVCDLENQAYDRYVDDRLTDGYEETPLLD